MQAVVRIDAPDGTPYLLVSRSGKDTGAACYSGSDHANIYIVRLGSRDTNGERLRSNRLRRGRETTDTPPDPADGVVDVMLFDGTTDWPHYEHPGAMQQVGTSWRSRLKTASRVSRPPRFCSSTSVILRSR